MADMFRTPLAEWHEQHGAKLAPFAGWYMPIQYEGILAEHKHTRTKASVFDICHMGEFTVEGEGAQQALMQAFTHSLADLKEQRCRYGFILNAEGGVLDDCIIYKKNESSFFIVVNAACIARDYETLTSRMPAGITCQNLSEQIAKIDLQGPESVDVLERVLGENLHDLPYFAWRDTEWQGNKLRVSRTGYTGELGYELYITPAVAVAFWERLLQEPEVKPAGLGARDTLRMEAGLALYGHELDEKHTPLEAGMDRMMTSQADYVGRKGLETVREKLVSLRLDGRRAVRNGDVVSLPSGETVGRITSGTFAPSLGYVIAFAWIKADKADADAFVVATSRSQLPAKKTTIPFYADGTARKKLR